MKKVLSFLFVAILAFSFTACKQEPSAVDIVKLGELSAYPGKPIAKTMDTFFEERTKNYQSEWVDITDLEISKELIEELKSKNIDYNRIVENSVNYNIDGEDYHLQFIWLVNTKDKTYELFSAYKNNELGDDEEVADSFHMIFQ